MYLKKIAISSIGPINELLVEMPFNSKGDPKPIIFVGENGSGKTILQSQIVDSFYEIGSDLFDDIGKQKGLSRSYYKISGGLNLQTGKEKGFSALIFTDDQGEKIEYFDKIGDIKKEDINKLLPDFSLSSNNKNDNQKIITNISDPQKKEKLQNEWLTGAHFFQPAYRYEEPFWKNDPFLDYQRFEDKKRFSNQLKKEIEIVSATKDNKSFLLDLVLDRFVQNANPVNLILWEGVNGILRKILKKDKARLGIGPRGAYRVSIVEDLEDKKSKQILPSIDSLSLGESILLNLFVNIIRHSGNYSKLFNQIQGIVAIDEIDVHLHTDLQNSVLPELIKLFPKVQFIITTHSPLFLLGMKKIFGDNGFEIRNMPNGEIITTERFSEFGKAYEVLKNTEKFEEDLKSKIIENKKPKVYVEGPTDIAYIKKAFELHEKKQALEKFEIEIIGENTTDGTKNSNNEALKNAGIFLKTKLGLLSQKIILLNDPEESIEEVSLDEKLYIRKINKIEASPIQKGIENLFTKTFIEKVKKVKPDCFEFHTIGTEIKNFQIVNRRKQEVCTWICENGTKNDFENFSEIIKIIENILTPQID
ncbi:MAG: AAA family ATPase [Candidatus Paceibacterota bacterium]